MMPVWWKCIYISVDIQPLSSFKQWHMKLSCSYYCVYWCRHKRCLIINITTVSPVYVCIWVELSGGWCAAFPSRGVLVLPVSKHPLDMKPSEGEQGPQCLTAPCALSWRRLPPWLPAPNPTWHAWRWGKHLSHEHCPHRDGPSPGFNKSDPNKSEYYLGCAWWSKRRNTSQMFFFPKFQIYAASF